MADKNMEAQISVEFEEATSRQSLNSGETINTLWSKVKRWLSDLKAVAFSGSYIDLSDKPTTATTDTDGLMSAEDKSKLDSADNTYALKSKYGDTTINVGRKAGTAGGIRSTAEGWNTTASGDYSHAEGASTTASGNRSHAEGYLCTASSGNSHAEGNNTTASGTHSHSEGDNTIASGIGSHAGGVSSIASSDYSFAHGMHVESNNSCEVSLGKFNKSSSDTLFSVGDGTSDSARHNAIEITTTGGKLHDKDIATTDIIPDLSAYAKKSDIPTSLPANGGNADTVDGLHADIFLKNEVLQGLSTSINDAITPEVYGVYSATPDFPTGYGDWGFLEIRRYGNTCYQTIRFDSGVIINRVKNITSVNWSEWQEIYTSGNKPYVTGTLSEQASGTNVTMSFTIFNFTPSKVLCQFGSGNAFFANVVTNGFSVTIPAGTTTIHYIAFK